MRDVRDEEGKKGFLPTYWNWGCSGAYTVLGALFIDGSLGPRVSMRYGIPWRQANKEKSERKEKAELARAEGSAEDRAAHLSTIEL